MTRPSFSRDLDAFGGFHPRVADLRAFAKYWLPALVWMALIFIGSSTVGSTENTSRFLEPLLRWLVPDITVAGIHRVQVVVRKSGHLAEYAILAVLLWRARRRPLPGETRPWNRREAAWAAAWAAAYAVTDELHQHFVPGRLGSVWDVLIDTLGAVLGLAAVWAAGRWRRRW